MPVGWTITFQPGFHPGGLAEIPPLKARGLDSGIWESWFSNPPMNHNLLQDLAERLDGLLNTCIIHPVMRHQPELPSAGRADAHPARVQLLDDLL